MPTKKSPHHDPDVVSAYIRKKDLIERIKMFVGSAIIAAGLTVLFVKIFQ